MDKLNLQLCNIQGRLFELSLDAGYDSESFIMFFMNSEIAELLDSDYNPMQWSGEECLLEAVAEKAGGNLTQTNKLYSKDEMFWMGYTYRYWHFITGESSKKIYKQALAQTMKINYYAFHTMDITMAIDDLKEIYMQKNG